MNKQNQIITFFNIIKKEKLLTLFIKNIFNYENFHDYNYIFRIKKEESNIVIDIYDNISKHRFNRYIIDFEKNNYLTKKVKENSIFITYICFNNIKYNNKRLLKFLYLFKLNKNYLYKYNKFLDQRFIKIIAKIITS